jgi:thiamine kinase-like enzyme
VFLPASSNVECTSEHKKAVMIDFSCVGIGYGMSDVAMHIVHAVLPADLENGQEEYLVEQYILALESAINKTGKNEWKFQREEALRQYQLACIDYLRFIMGRFWKTATPETFEKKKNSKNTTLINRDVKAAMAFIEKVDKYLEVFEKEKIMG